MIFLMSPSLVEKIKWAKTAPNSPHRDRPGETWRSVAWDELEMYLQRKQTEMPPAASYGINLEDKVYAEMNKPVDQIQGSSHFNELCDMFRGMTTQKYEENKISFRIYGEEYEDFLKYYGFCDGLNTEDKELKDLKATGNYRTGKYVKTVQHLFYTALWETRKFTYVIAEWDKYPKINRVITEEFFTDKFPGGLEGVKAQVNQECLQALQTIYDWGFWDYYIDIYCRRANEKVYGEIGYKKQIADRKDVVPFSGGDYAKPPSVQF